MPHMMKIGVVGLGKMGEALISGLLLSKAYNSKDIYGYDIIPERCNYIQSKYKINILNNISELASKIDLVVLVVKPQDISKVIKELSKISTAKIVLSLAAGISTNYLETRLPKGITVIRAMPNLACSIGEGMICITHSEAASKKYIDKVSDILQLTGKVIKVDEENMAVITGLSGSGPAFVYTFIESLADAGVRLGLKRELAVNLAAQTTLGASKLVIFTGEHTSILKDKVVTPGGTTIEGLVELEKNGFKGIIIESVSKSAEKARQIQNKLNEMIK